MGETRNAGVGRAARGIATIAAGAVLALGMAGCGTGDGQGEAPTTEEKVTESAGEGGSDGGTGGVTDPDAGSEDTQEGTVSDDGGEAAGGPSAGRPPAVLYVVDGVDDAVDTSQAQWTLSGDDLATVLAGQGVISDRTAPSCSGDLAFTDGSSVNCKASFDMEGLDGEQDLTVMAVRAPSGFDATGAPALLISIGAAPSQEALEVFTDQDNHLVGIGQGSMFGTDELSAEELAQGIQATANNDAGYAVLDAPVVVTECEGPLPAGSAEPVGCDAAWEHSPDTPFDVEAMAVWFVDSDPGLLVALEIGDQAGEGDEG